MPHPAEILLVEDDPADAELTMHALARATPAAAVELAPDAESAFHALRTNSAGRRLVLLDLKLPGTSGLELLERIRGDAGMRTVPVVVFTSSAEPRDLEGSYRLGANAYAQKPVEFGAFGDTVHRICAFWLGVNRLPAPSR